MDKTKHNRGDKMKIISWYARQETPIAQNKDKDIEQKQPIINRKRPHLKKKSDSNDK